MPIDHPLSERVIRVCDDMLDWIDEPARPVVRELIRQLQQPLSVAVVGAVKAGKSTLVNALIGRRIAPTAATECTRVVTWYRHGRSQHAQVVRHDGTARPLPIEDGLPATLGVDLTDAQRIEVQLPEAPLRTLTIVDTPGLASLATDLQDTTQAAVLGEKASRAAPGQVDAIIYLFRDIEKAHDLSFVEAFAAATGGHASAVNTVGVLARADEQGSGAYGDKDPFDVAARLAQRIANDHADALADVVPVSGLLAETRRSGRLDEPAIAALARLAGTPDSHLRLWQRLRPQDAAGVDDATMEHLYRSLGPYGVRHGRSHSARGAAVVYQWLEHRSGINQLETVIQHRFTRRADVLKATRALASLRRLRWDAGLLSSEGGRRLGATLEEAELRDPMLQRARELQVTEALLRRGNAPADVLQALDSLVSGGTQAQMLGLPESARDGVLLQRAREQAAWAQGVASSASSDPALAEAGRVLSRSYVLILQDLQAAP